MPRPNIDEKLKMIANDEARIIAEELFGKQLSKEELEEKLTDKLFLFLKKWYEKEYEPNKENRLFGLNWDEWYRNYKETDEFIEVYNDWKNKAITEEEAIKRLNITIEEWDDRMLTWHSKETYEFD